MSTPSSHDIRLVEALVFASAEPVSEQAVLELLRSRTPVRVPEVPLVPDDRPGDGPGGVTDTALGMSSDDASDRVSGALAGDARIDGLGDGPADAAGAAVGTTHARAVLLAVQARFADGGVVLSEVANGWQFRTAPDLAPALTTVLERPRRLPRVAMETLAIVAYHQPCTRTDIEAIRGVSLGQTTLDQLLEAGLILPRGRKEVPGRPILWGTSPSFLQRFGLANLRDLPRREELLVELPAAGTEAASNGDTGIPRSAEGDVEDRAEERAVPVGEAGRHDG